MALIPNKGFTHAGVFHADDVFSSALLMMLNPDIAIQRGFEVPEAFDGIVFDIGGGEFDHHGPCRRTRDNGVPFAAFGLLWECFGGALLTEEDAEAFDESFVQPIDDADNGGDPCQISQLVSDFNPAQPTDGEAYDRAFDGAVAWAKSVLERRFERIRNERSFAIYVEQRMGECDGRVLVLDHFVPWKKVVVGSGYVYVVYPSARQGYNVQAVPVNQESRSLVRPFPVSWRGKDRQELVRLTGEQELIFCHPSGFLCSTETEDSALRVARLALRQE